MITEMFHDLGMGLMILGVLFILIGVYFAVSDKD